MRKLLSVFVALSVWLVASLANAAPTKSFVAASASLPADIEILGTSNLKQLKATDTFKKVFPELLKIGGGKIGDGIDKIKKTCGIDAVSSFDDATLGVDKRQDGAIFLAVNGVTEQKFVDCLTKIGKGEGAAVTTKKSGSITEVKSDKSSKSLFYAWLTGDVLVIATDPDDKALLEKMTGGRGAILKSKLAARMLKMDPSAALSVAWAKEIPVDKMTVKSGDLTITSSNGTVTATTNIEMGGAREAEKIAAAAKVLTSFLSLPKSAPKEVERLLKSLDAKANGNEVRIAVQAQERDLTVIAGWALKEALGKR